jgi:hypothetical protein
MLKNVRFGQWFQRRSAVQGAVRPVLIAVGVVLAQDPPQTVLVPRGAGPVACVLYIWCLWDSQQASPIEPLCRQLWRVLRRGGCRAPGPAVTRL